jgi:hypothetical protein
MEIAVPVHFLIEIVLMKFIAFCLLGLLAITAYGENPPKKSDASKDNLRGQVKKVVEISYSKQKPPPTLALDGFLEKNETLFNRDGYITESTLTNAVIKNEGESFLHQVFEYDKKGQPIACVNTKEYGLILIDSFTCDGLGNVVIQQRYHTNHSLLSKVVNLYDEMGRELLRSDYDVNDTLLTLTCETETTYFDLEHQRETKTRCHGIYEDVLTSLDEKGRPTRVQLLDKSKNTIKEWDWTFDNFDNMTSCEERVDGLSKEVRRYTYQYDTTGNWITRTELVDGKATVATDRAIAYY